MGVILEWVISLTVGLGGISLARSCFSLWRICGVGGIKKGTDQVVSNSQEHTVLAVCMVSQ